MKEPSMIKKLKYIFDPHEQARLVGLFIMMLICSALELLAVAVFNPFINILMNPNYINTEAGEWIGKLCTYFGITEIEKLVIIISVIIALVYIVKNVYTMFWQNTMLSFVYNTRMKLSVNLLSTYLREPYSFHRQKNIAEMQRCLQTDTNQFMNLINSSLQLLVELMTCIVLAVYLFDTSHSIAVILFILLATCVLISSIISKKVASKLGRQNELYNAKLFQWINQSLGGIKELKILEREEYFLDKYSTNYKKLIKGAKNNELIAAYPKYLIEMVCMVGIVGAIIFKMLFGRGELTSFIPQLSVFAVAAMRLMPSAGKINAYYTNVMYNKASLDMIYNDLKSVENMDNGGTRKDDLAHSINLTDCIEVEGLSYHYDDTEELVLKDINLTINKGQTIAIIGASGSGKTTFADIFLGLLRQTSGCLKVDGADIYGNISSWHRAIGYIPQTIYLSDDTIRNNVAFGINEDDISDEAIWKALEMAQLASFVKGLEEGLDTMVGDRGVRLSGGQRQRIGIARAVYHDPEILVLDEATSALDNETEMALMASIENLQGKKTMVIIAHRLTTIRNADAIYEIKNGEAVLRKKEEVIK